MDQNRKALSDITLEDAFIAYSAVAFAARVMQRKRLSEDYDGNVVLQRHNRHNDSWDTVVLFKDGYAYCFGGDSPERFEKNIRINFKLFTMGYHIHFTDLGIPQRELLEFASIFIQQKQIPV